MENDLTLIRNVLDGSVDSFNMLLNKYESPVYRYVYNMINDREASLDLCQEVFIMVYNKLYMYKQDCKFSNWIFKIAKNKTIDYLRKSRKVSHINIDDASEALSKETSPEEWAEYIETGKFVREFVKTLKDADRSILSMKYSNLSLTFCDIAQVLNMSEAGVKRRYYRMRDRFKDFISDNKKRCKV